MYKLGLTGSLAMGKTTVARMFEEMNVPVFHSDQAVHDLFDKSKRIKNQISAAFPTAIAKDKVDRERLASLVFKSRQKLAELEAIVHPGVIREVRKFVRKNSDAPLVVLDMPLLFEIGSDDYFDGIAVVSASPAAQRKRAFLREGMTEGRFQMIVERQLPDAEKRARADFIIPTGGPLKETRAAVQKLVAKLREKAQ